MYNCALVRSCIWLFKSDLFKATFNFQKNSDLVLLRKDYRVTGWLRLAGTSAGCFVPVLAQGQLEQAVRMYLRQIFIFPKLRCYSLSEKPVPVFDQPHGKECWGFFDVCLFFFFSLFGF